MRISVRADGYSLPIYSMFRQGSNKAQAQYLETTIFASEYAGHLVNLVRSEVGKWVRLAIREIPG